jgi:type IX secretion system PorP/SprF family membrane protein
MKKTSGKLHPALFLIMLVSLLVGLPDCAAQTQSYYRQFFFNPYLFNPAFAAIDGRGEVNIGLRKQWLDFQDAPTTGGINVQVPSTSRVILGGNFISQTQVLLQSSTLNASFTYIVPFSEKQQLRFGLSGGIGMNRLNLTADELNTVDPVIANAAGTTIFPDGSFGVVYSAGGLRAGISVTNVFNNNPLNPQRFEGFQFSNFRNRLYSLGYRWDPSGDRLIEIEPYALYRQNTDRQLDTWEVATVVHLREVLSFGGSYDRNRGIGIFAGFNLGRSARVSYSYELGSAGTNTSSHELHLGLRFGQPKAIHRPVSPPKKAPAIVKDAPAKQELPLDPGRADTIIYVTPATTAPVEEETAKEKPLRYFVVAGVFQEEGHARDFARNLIRKGHFAGIFVHPGNGRHYVYLFVSPDILEARRIRGVYRQRMPELKAWILTSE